LVEAAALATGAAMLASALGLATRAGADADAGAEAGAAVDAAPAAGCERKRRPDHDGKEAGAAGGACWTWHVVLPGGSDGPRGGHGEKAIQRRLMVPVRR